ncbi:MAG TPA: hypothetical protein VIY86_11915, partial [Pirellulaceae bacterium]
TIPSDTRTAPRRHLMTAEQLLRQQSPEPAPVPTANDAAMLLPIELGMVVRHPKYGLGKVVALSGLGKAQSGKIQFFDPPQERTFRLAHSCLQAVRPGMDHD